MPQSGDGSVSRVAHPKLSPYAAYRFWRVVRRRLGSSTVYCQPCLRQNASASCAPGSKQVFEHIKTQQVMAMSY